MDTTVAPLPRGGATAGITPLEVRAIHKEVENDVLFGKAGSKTPKTPKQKKRAAEKPAVAKEVDLSDPSAFLETPKAKYVPDLTLRSLSVGMQVMGYVRDIQEMQLVIGLPNNLSGVVPITEISDELTALLVAAQKGMEDSDSESEEESDDVPSLRDLFRPFQLVKAAVVEVKTEKPVSVQLSLRPSLINTATRLEDLVPQSTVYCAVKSVEDHGYVLGFGNSTEITGFMPFQKSDDKKGKKRKRQEEEEDDEDEDEKKYLVGQVLEASVVSYNKGAGIITLCTNAAERNMKLELPEGAPSFNQIQAGTLVPVRMEKVVGNGVYVFVHEYMLASVHRYHLPNSLDQYDAGKKKYVGRVLYINYTTKTMAVSLKDSLVKNYLVNMTQLPPNGEIVEGQSTQYTTGSGAEVRLGNMFTARVMEVHGAGVGVRLQYEKKKKKAAEEEGENDEEFGSKRNFFCFVHKSNLSDTEVKDVARQFSPGSSHQCRVIGYNAIDDLVIVSLKKSVMKESFLTHGELQAGQEVVGKVESIVDSGLKVKLGRFVTALCPSAHMADVVLRNPAAKFRVNQKLKFRVLKVSAPSRSALTAIHKQPAVLLTRRKGLLESPLPAIVSYESAKPGDVSHGYIVAVKPNGVLVSFYNDVHGFVPLDQLHVAGEDDSADTVQEKSKKKKKLKSVLELFRKGQIVKARVLYCAPEKNLLRLTFNMDSPLPEKESAESRKKRKIGEEKGEDEDAVMVDATDSASLPEVGKLVSGVVQAVSSDGIVLLLQEPRTLAYLGMQHLSDHTSHCHPNALGGCYLVGDTINGALVIDTVTRAKDPKKVLLSLKTTLVRAAEKGTLLCSIEQGEAKGKVLDAYISDVNAKLGCFVSLVGGAQGLARLSELADSYIKTPSTVFTQGQSVRAYVLEEDDERRKMALSLKHSLTRNRAPHPCLEFLASYFRDEDLMRQHLERAIGDEEKIQYRPGDVVEGLVRSVKEVGVTLEIGNFCRGFAVARNVPKTAKMVAGEKVHGRVLDVSYKNSRVILDLSLLSEHVGVVGNDGKLVRQTSKSNSTPKKSKKKESMQQGGPHYRDIVQTMAVGEVVTGKVLLVKKHYLVCLLVDAMSAVVREGLESGCSSILAFVTPLSVTHPVADPPLMSTYVPGQSLRLKYESLPSAPDGKKGKKKKGAAAALDPHQLCSDRLVAAIVDSTTAQPGLEGGVSSVKDLVPGMVVDCRVEQIQRFFLQVHVGPHVRGRIHVTEVTNEIPKEAKGKAEKGKAVEKLKDDQVLELQKGDATHPFRKFKVGDVVKARVLHVDEVAARHRQLAITHQQVVSRNVVFLTLKTEELAKGAAAPSPRPSMHSLVVGQRVSVCVQEVGRTTIWALLGPNVRGRLQALDASSDLATVNDLRTTYVPGAQLECYVLAHDPAKKRLDLSVRKPTELEVAQEHAGVVVKKDKVSLTVEVSGRRYGRVYITDGVAFDKNPFHGAKIGSVVRVEVVEAGSGDKVDFKLKEVLGAGATPKLSEKIARGKVVSALSDVEVGGLVRAYIVNARKEVGLFLALARNVTGRVVKSQISDKFIENFEAMKDYSPGKCVVARVIAVIQGKQADSTPRLELSLRPSVVKKDGWKSVSYEDIKVGDKLYGNVKKVESYGVFITIEHSRITGLCHISEVLDEKVENLDKMYNPGDYVKVIVKKKNEEKKQLSLGLKPSYFENDEAEEAEEAEEDEDVEEEEESSEEESDVEDMEVDSSKKQSEDQEEDSEEGEEEDNDEESEEEESQESESEEEDASLERKRKRVAPEPVAPASSKRVKVAKEPDSLSTGDSMLWDDLDLAEEKDDESAEEQGSDEDGAGDANVTDKQKRRVVEEERIRAIEKRMQEQQAPATEQEFERLLLGSRNSSYVWMKYMAYLLSRGEEDKARAIADRALNEIAQEEQGERVNVWSAYMSLENNFGTEESVAAVFSRALRVCEPKAIHEALINIYIKSEKFELADRIYKLLCKKFPESKKVWMGYAKFQLEKLEDISLCRQTLQQALKRLPKRKHISFISQMGRLEFKEGSKDRGRTIFEGLITHYPKRYDLWLQYLDQEERIGDVDTTRQLYERAVHLNLSSKKMKSLFKRYLQFERDNGNDAARIKHVKDAVLQYLQQKE